MSDPAENFDTLKFANRLKDSGVSSMTAEVLADELNIALSRHVDMHKKESASKLDLQLTETKLSKDISEVRSELKQEATLLRKDMVATETKLSKDISQVRSELSQEVSLLRQDMLAMENRLIKSMSKIVFGGFSAFGLVVVALHYFKIMV